MHAGKLMGSSKMFLSEFDLILFILFRRDWFDPPLFISSGGVFCYQQVMGLYGFLHSKTHI